MKVKEKQEMKLSIKRCIVAAVLACVCAAFADVRKPVVYADYFKRASGDNVRMQEGDLQTLQNRIVGNLVSSRKYQVVEREDLAKVQAELKLVDAGMTEGDAPESNRLKAAGYIIYGTVQQFRTTTTTVRMDDNVVRNGSANVEIQIRFANITTGQILCSRDVKVKRTKQSFAAGAKVESSKNSEQEALVEALEEAARKVVAALNNVAFPVWVVDADAKYVTGNVADALVTTGDLWEIVKRGRAIKDPDSGEILGYKETEICTVRVSRPGPKMTKFEYVNAKDAKVVEEFLDAEAKLEMRRLDDSRQQNLVKPPKRTLFREDE